jgi:hypothetical protein
MAAIRIDLLIGHTEAESLPILLRGELPKT